MWVVDFFGGKRLANHRGFIMNLAETRAVPNLFTKVVKGPANFFVVFKVRR